MGVVAWCTIHVCTFIHESWASAYIFHCILCQIHVSLSYTCITMRFMYYPIFYSLENDTFLQ